MRMDPTRKCSRFADVEKFSDFRRSNGDVGLSNNGVKASNNDLGPSNLRKQSQFQHSHFRGNCSPLCVGLTRGLGVDRVARG